jgi:7,8-dihydropterin-6-yl-methyl-4-(beta-D-ribofuranosyl)aminobenzene 5'-phosphate synthase
MKVAVLVDNNPDPEQRFLTEHGLSIYFEADGFKWLFDVGASDYFYTNAVRLGIDIKDIDFLVLSHGHIDHIGGLAQFVKENNKARIIVSAHIEGKAFYSYRHTSKKNIGTDFSLIDQNRNRSTFVVRSTRISENVGVVCEIPRVYEIPKANRKLTQLDSDGEKPDDFQHEVALAVNTDKGMVVFSGCSHNGILNILKACSNYTDQSKIIACIGGTHLIDSDSVNTYESESEIKEIGRSIIGCYPNMKLITGHCTGLNAKHWLSNSLENDFRFFHSGDMITI